LQGQVDMLFADIVNAGVSPKGPFRITFPHALESNVVIPAINQLCAEYPDLKPELIGSDSRLDLVSNNLDIAIHAGELQDSSYRALPVGTMTEVFCATPLYLNRSPSLKSLKDLCKHRWIATSWQHQKMSIIHLDKHKTAEITLKQVAQANTLPSALEMALHHMGFVLLPEIIAKPLIKTGELVHIVEHISGPQWPVHILHAYQGKRPIHITRFHQIVCRFFAAI
jgi:DNA-binding transcriptional LysR family regulator